MKFLRGVMDVYRRDDDDEDGMRVTSITRMVFPSGLLQSTDHHLLYLTERVLPNNIILYAIHYVESNETILHI
ncbi:hypothetical protein CsSME_00030914 [Camellia sinensis var. sinensis]